MLGTSVPTSALLAKKMPFLCRVFSEPPGAHPSLLCCQVALLWHTAGVGSRRVCKAQDMPNLSLQGWLRLLDRWWLQPRGVVLPGSTALSGGTMQVGLGAQSDLLGQGEQQVRQGTRGLPPAGSRRPGVCGWGLAVPVG